MAIPTGKDITEWVKAGGTAEELDGLYQSAPVLTAEGLSAWRAAHGIEEVASPATEKHQSLPKLKTHTIKQIEAEKLKPLEPLYFALLFAGIILLLGKAKIGKSWLALQLAICAAAGKPFLGFKPTRKMRVVYLALEDNKRRTLRRYRLLCKALGINESEANGIEFIYREDILPMADGGVEQLLEYFGENPPDLVIIDTLLATEAGSTVKTGRNVTKEDYARIERFRPLTNKFENLAMVVVHHARKAKADVGSDAAQGTQALSGSVDDIWYLKGNPKEGPCVLDTSGRDTDGKDISIQHVSDGDSVCWQYVGEGAAAAAEQSRAKKPILDLLKQSGPLKCREIAERLGKPSGTVQRLLPELKADCLIKTTKQGYVIADDPDNLYVLPSLLSPREKRESEKLCA